MRKRRTIYFNDARHYYLFVFEPPMKLEDAWIPIDECAGTAVDTFVYGVARDDGLFYPSKVGPRFGTGMPPFTLGAYYRVWHNMQSLMDRGLDPLTVLIDRAHDKGMEFIASLRLGTYSVANPSLLVQEDGKGFADQEARDHNLRLLKELVLDYDTDGVELDFTAPPAGSAPLFRPQDAAASTPVLTAWVRQVSDLARSRGDRPALVGARVYPTIETNAKAGYDVPAWLQEGLLDYVTPLVYAHSFTDSNMPIEWLTKSAHAHDCAVYPMIGPYYATETRQFHTREWATPAMMRAAMANYWEMGADGMYTYFLRWPLDDAGKRILTEMGDPDLIRGATKHYLVGRKTEYATAVGYDTPILPLEIPETDSGTPCTIPFTVADDIEGNADHIREVRLKINITDLLADDRLTIRLNGRSLENEPCRRSFLNYIDAWMGQWIEFTLEDARPCKGRNVLEILLDERAPGMASKLMVEDVEVVVEYHPYPSVLNRP